MASTRYAVCVHVTRKLDTAPARLVSAPVHTVVRPVDGPLTSICVTKPDPYVSRTTAPVA